MDERFRQEAESPSQASELLTATAILMGMRFNKDLVIRLIEEVGAMEESVIYQHIIEKGLLKGERRALLLLGSQRFGTPSPALQAALDGVDDVGCLERMMERLHLAVDWDDLLATP
jgi:hypothetical protein